MYNILGYAFSAYCLYRMVMSSINIILDRDPTKDPVTRGFEVRLSAHTLHSIYFHADVVALFLNALHPLHTFAA